MVLNIINNNVNENIVSIPPLKIPKLSGLGRIYYDRMLQYKDLIAQTDTRTGETETYGSLLKRTIRTAIGMRTRGIRPKDIISVCSYNTMDTFIPFYASFFMGAVSANLDPGLPLADTIHLMNQTKPKMIFVVPEALQLIEVAVQRLALDTQIVVFGKTTEYTQFSEFLISTPEEDDFVPYEVEDLKETAAIVFTSGSHGLPKGACLSHLGLMALIYQINSVTFPRNAALLAVSSLYWISAVSLTQYFLTHGANRIICQKFDPAEVWSLIKKYKILGMFLNSYHALEFNKNGRPEGADTSSLKFALLSGANLTKDQMRKFKECLPETVAFNGYGQTESCGCNLAFNTSSEEDLRLLEKNPDSVGRPIAGYTYKIVDPETEEVLGPNQKGELRIKSDNYMNGYYNIDSFDAWDSEGFFKTGDIAYYDEDKCFFVVDRIKDLLKYHVWQISPAALDNILHTHPAVHRSVVVGIPDQIHGDILTAVVVLKTSHESKVTADELQKYVDDQVAEYQKLRGGVKIVKELPLTVTDKISRKLVMQHVIEGKI